MIGTLHKNNRTGEWYIQDAESNQRIPLYHGDYTDIIADKEDASIPDGDYEGDVVEYQINPDDQSGYITRFIRTKGDDLGLNDLL